jgi:cytochrome P450
VTSTEDLPVLPFDRPGALDVAPLLMRLQAERPVTRVRTPAGDVAWLVTRYDDVKSLFGDRRLGRTHPDPERAPRFTNSVMLGGPMGRRESDEAQHARMRRLLTPSFTVKRMNLLRPRVQATVDGVLDRIEGLPQPVDLHAELALPVPVLVICDLLGVPYEDRDEFRAWSEAAGNTSDLDRSRAGLEALHRYMARLVAVKRANRAEDVISDLIAAGEEDPAFPEPEMIGLAAGLLFAGHETTVARIDLGVLLLLTHEDQRRALQRDPSLARSAVEEILRLASPGLGMLPRYALADIDLDGVRIRDGDLVLLASASANRDAGAFADPRRFDVRRQENQHLSFGHGHHFCLGAGLARVELQVVFGTLLRRLPGVRLAVPAEDLRLRSGYMTGGLTALPVAW